MAATQDSSAWVAFESTAFTLARDGLYKEAISSMEHAVRVMPGHFIDGGIDAHLLSNISSWKGALGVRTATLEMAEG